MPSLHKVDMKLSNFSLLEAEIWDKLDIIFFGNHEIKFLRQFVKYYQTINLLLDALEWNIPFTTK